MRYGGGSVAGIAVDRVLAVGRQVNADETQGVPASELKGYTVVDTGRDFVPVPSPLFELWQQRIATYDDLLTAAEPVGGKEIVGRLVFEFGVWTFWPWRNNAVEHAWRLVILPGPQLASPLRDLGNDEWRRGVLLEDLVARTESVIANAHSLDSWQRAYARVARLAEGWVTSGRALLALHPRREYAG